jgi:hypothetical protein
MKKLFTIAIAVASFCIGNRAAAQTYCTPGATSCDETINNFTLNTINNSSIFCSTPTTGYTDFTNLSTTLTASLTYNFSVTIGPSYVGDTLYVWIDLNHNFVFDASELLKTIAITKYAAHDTIYNSTLTIPANATPGSTRLRARVGYLQNIGPCGTATYGEAEDYTVNIIYPPCTGTPGAATITTAPIAGHLCNNAMQTLTAADNANFTSGIYYQWQQSLTGAAGSFTNVMGGTGANTLTYTTPPLAASMFYRIQDSCANTQLTNSSPAFGVPVSPSVIGIQPVSMVACSGTSTTFSFTPNGNGLTYQWQVDNGSGFTNISNGTTYSGVTSTTLTINNVLASMAGYNYRVVVSGGCQGSLPSSPATLTIGAFAKITVTRPTTFCSGDSAILTANSGVGYVYQWYQNGSLVAGNQTYIARVNGTYSLLVIGTNGCTATDAVSITVNPSPALPVVTVNGPTTFCFGNTVSLTSNYNGITGYTYQWYLNNANIIGATNNTYNTQDSGSYTFAAVGANGCRTTSSAVRLNTIVIATPVVILSNGTYCSVNSYAHYQWYMNGSVSSGDTLNCFTPSKSGTYYLGASDTNRCTRYSTSYLVNLGFNNFGSVAAQIRMYPNPASSFVSIVSPVAIHAIISTIDGREVLQQNNVKTIEISSLATGMYLLRIYNSDNMLLKVEKLVKE